MSDVAHHSPAPARMSRRRFVASTDAAGAAWRSGDIIETAAITSLLTMMFVVAPWRR